VAPRGVQGAGGVQGGVAAARALRVCMTADAGGARQGAAARGLTRLQVNTAFDRTTQGASTVLRAIGMDGHIQVPPWAQHFVVWWPRGHAGRGIAGFGERENARATELARGDAGAPCLLVLAQRVRGGQAGSGQRAGTRHSRQPPHPLLPPFFPLLFCRALFVVRPFALLA
jgi:hypothetical protein